MLSKKISIVFVTLSLLLSCTQRNFNNPVDPEVEVEITSLTTPEDNNATNDNTPTLTWEAVELASSYHLQVSQNSTFSNPVLEECNIASTTYTFSSPLVDGIYFWRVRVRFGEDRWGEWSQNWNFCTPVHDIDGNVYLTIKIGDQWWIAENLKVTHYQNGDDILNVTNDTEWSELTTGAYCVNNNDEKNAETYGYLYNWYAVDDSRNIAPEGWHVPTLDEWVELITYFGDDAGAKLKEEGNEHWNNPNTGTNESGFTALPGGYQHESGSCAVGVNAMFWTATEENIDESRWVLLYNSVSYVDFASVPKLWGCSLRCIKN